MANIDKYLGKRGGQHLFTSHRVDYNSERDIRFIKKTEEVEKDDGSTQTVVVSKNKRWDDISGMKSPHPSNNHHSVKAGYKRKIVVESETKKNQVTDYLDKEEIDYTIEKISVSKEERDAIIKKDPMNEVEALDILQSPSIVLARIRKKFVEWEGSKGKGLKRMNSILKEVPTFVPAIKEGNTEIAKLNVDEAENQSLLTSSESKEIKGLVVA